MKTKFFRALRHAIPLLMVLVIAYSCEDSNNYLDEFEIRRMIEEEIRENNKELEFTQWKIVNITVKISDWEWFNDESRYEATYDLPELTEFIYESGAQLGYVYIGEQGKNEVQKILPFVHTYWEKNDDGDEFIYTETISCDYMYGKPSSVAFYIQSSDLFRNDDILGNFNFRIVLVW